MSRYSSFDMSSPSAAGSPAGQTPGAGGSGSLSRHHSGLGGGGGGSTIGPAAHREAEQRFARLVAESEYKLLEEKSRAQEREQRLLEELARERALVPKLAQERADAILKEREREIRADVMAHLMDHPPPHHGNKAGGGQAQLTHDSQHTANLRSELDRVTAELTESRRLHAEAESKFQREKKELLNLRAAQLKSETAKKGQEGDIIARAMQVMSEYENVIRSAEEGSLARLAHHMESFEKEWLRRARSFEEQKSEFESMIMEKALGALRTNNEDIEAIGQRILDKTLKVLQHQGDTRLQIEEEVLSHSESFKQQYKEILEHEFRERCRAYDQQIAQRERNLVSIMQKERERVIGEEKKIFEEHQEEHLKSLTNAMKEISDLREQLVREHQEAQGRSIQELILRRNEMNAEQERIIEASNGRVAKIEKQCLEAVEAAQQGLRDMQSQIAAKEADMTERLITVDMEREKRRVEEIASVREEVEQHWKVAMDELRQRHSDELAHQLTELQNRIDLIHTEQFQREQELRHNYETRIVRAEESADDRWAKRVQETSRSLERHLEVIQALREDNEQLAGQLSSLQDAYESREREVAMKIAAVQREHEQVWHHKMEEMRVRYDKLLDEALCGTSDGVSVAEYRRMTEMLKQAEERLIEYKKTEADRMSAERLQLNNMWQDRLEEERADRGVWEQDQLKKLTELRVELQADSRKRETELMRRIDQEKLMLHDGNVAKVLEEKRDRDAFERALREQCDARVREAEEEYENAYNDKSAFLERSYEEKEADIERRRREMRKQMTDFEEATKKKATAWLNTEKEEILADVRNFHAKLLEEEKNMHSRQQTFERDTLEKYSKLFDGAKADLQASALSVSQMHVDHWKDCEAMWLETRATEIGMILTMKREHAAACAKQGERWRDEALKAAQETVARERADIEKRLTDLHQRHQQAMTEVEEKGRQRSLSLLDERNRIHEESEKQRSAEEARLWEAIQLRIMEKEREGEKERRILEAELRNKYEALMTAERKRVDDIMELNTKEHRELTARAESEARRREEEWMKHRIAMEQKEAEIHEQRYSEIRRQCEERIVHERNRHEKALREREEGHASERQVLLDKMDSQLKDHAAAVKLQTLALRDDYEKRIKQMSQDLYLQRERFVTELAEQQQRLHADRESYEAESLRKFEKTISDLRDTLERRNREYHQRELEARAVIEVGKREYEERINKQYADLLKEHKEALLKLQKDRDERADEVEQAHREDMLRIRSEMEAAMHKIMQVSDAEVAKRAGDGRALFEGKIKEHHDLLTEERAKRIAAESRVQELTMEMEVLRSGVEQHKLDVHRSIQSKFENLFTNLREQSRKEKEDLARAMLEEEERRVAAELVKKDNDYRLQGIREGHRQQQQQQQPSAQSPAVGGGRFEDPYASASLPPAATPARQAGNQSTAGAATSGKSGHMSVADAAAADQARKKRERLQQLWQLLDFPHDDRNRFLESIVSHSPTDILAALTAEVRRMELMLPLLELITKKEFLQHRTSELRRQGGRPTEVESYMAELERLLPRIREEVQQYESKHRTHFMFRGQRYLHLLEQETAASFAAATMLGAPSAAAAGAQPQQGRPAGGSSFVQTPPSSR